MQKQKAKKKEVAMSPGESPLRKKTYIIKRKVYVDERGREIKAK